MVMIIKMLHVKVLKKTKAEIGGEYIHNDCLRSGNLMSRVWLDVTVQHGTPVPQYY